MSEEQKPFGKVLSTKGPALHLIPMEALVGLADRFQKGVERKGDGAWNALSANQECLVDKDFLLDRISHIIAHALKFRDQLVRGVSPDEESMYDNAGAVAFGGALLLCAAREVCFEAKHVPVAQPDWSLEAGLTYPTVGQRFTGSLCRFDPPRLVEHSHFFSKTYSEVNWRWDGTPVKINMSMGDSELEKFRIPYGAEGVID